MQSTQANGKKGSKRPASQLAPPQQTTAAQSNAQPSQATSKKRPKVAGGLAASAGVAGSASTLSLAFSTTSSTRPSAESIEELEWIDRCKRAINNKATYNEFLKILNLFSQEIIDSKTLVERLEPFLSRTSDLFDWIKKFMKYEETLAVCKLKLNCGGWS
jgi:paired amphipathic helix protein Sin3a